YNDEFLASSLQVPIHIIIEPRFGPYINPLTISQLPAISCLYASSCFTLTPPDKTWTMPKICGEQLRCREVFGLVNP
ncbi:hypothetical protein LINGRAHAP2_LOCUS20612, partial [Linum grandiflorum]